MCDLSVKKKPFVIVLFISFSEFCFGQLNPQQFGPNNRYPIQNPSVPPPNAFNDRGFDRNNNPYYVNEQPVNDRRPFGTNQPPDNVQRVNQSPGNFGPTNTGRRLDDGFNTRNRVNGDIRGLLQALDLQASQQCTNNVAAQWNFETNINQATQLEAVSTIL